MADEIIKATPADAGCWSEGSRGVYGPAHVIELAIAHGWPGTDRFGGSAAQDARYMNDYEAGQAVQEQCSEHVLSQGGWLDEAEEWLNANVAPDGYSFGWHDGEFFLSPYCGTEDGCDDDACWCQT